jgi:hypothetical protein
MLPFQQASKCLSKVRTNITLLVIEGKFFAEEDLQGMI